MKKVIVLLVIALGFTAAVSAQDWRDSLQYDKTFRAHVEQQFPQYTVESVIEGKKVVRIERLGQTKYAYDVIIADRSGQMKKAALVSLKIGNTVWEYKGKVFFCEDQVSLLAETNIKVADIQKQQSVPSTMVSNSGAAESGWKYVNTSTGYTGQSAATNQNQKNSQGVADNESKAEKTAMIIGAIGKLANTGLQVWAQVETIKRFGTFGLGGFGSTLGVTPAYVGSSYILNQPTAPYNPFQGWTVAQVSLNPFGRGPGFQ